MTIPAAVLLCFTGPTLADSESSRIPQLIEALDDEGVRYGASIALAALGTEAVPALQESLASDNLDRRVWSAYTLGEIGSAAELAVCDLTQALDNTDSAIRAAAAQALGKIGPASASSVGALAESLSDENPEVRRRSVVALGQIGPSAEKAAPQLIAALKDSRIRQAARTSLIQIGESAASALEESLDNDHVRFDISAILLKVDPEAAKQAGVHKPTSADLESLRLALRDLTRTRQEQTAAATALAHLGQEGIAALIEAFEERSIADTAAAAFVNIGPDGVAPLVTALGHEEPGVRSAAANALGHIGPAANKAVPDLVQLFKDDARDVRYCAVRALDALGQAASPAVPDLIELMLDSSQREPARQWAIMTLGNTLPDTHEEVVKALIKASQDKGNYGVSSLARQQVRKIDLEAAEAAGVR
jgi:HEAT repeat protein